MEKQVWRDREGNLINIGPWDFMERDEPYLHTETIKEKASVLLPNGKPMTDSRGRKMMREVSRIVQEERIRTVITNPLPSGAYEAKADIVEGAGGGLYEKNVPAI